MSLEELFEHISTEFMARINDEFPPGVLVNSKLPPIVEREVTSDLGQLFDLIESRAPFLNQNNTEKLSLLEVDEDDEYAIIEVVPRKESDFATEPYPSDRPGTTKRRTKVIARPSR